jgi:hypothetical protein
MLGAILLPYNDNNKDVASKNDGNHDVVFFATVAWGHKT